MTLRLLVFLMILLAWPASLAAQTPPPQPQTWISGGDLPGRVRLSAVDEDDFQRRINLPPLLEDEPSLSGPSYTVESPYWDHAVRGEESDEPEVELTALYYPQGGYVRTRQDGEDVWLVIDLQQRAVLDRYIRLAHAGLIDEQPGPLEVLAAAVANGETVDVQIGTLDLDEQQTEAFWQVASGLEPLDLDPGADWQAPRGGPNSVWLIFNLTEGRSQQMLYTPGADTLVDRLGASVYALPRDWLTPVLGDDAPQPGQPIAYAAGEIEQQESTGSALWWPLLIGGGLACIAAAVYLRRLWA